MILAASLTFLALALPAAPPAPIELLRDPHFQTGFRVLAPVQGKRVIEGELRVDPEAEPVWDLAQWDTRGSLAGTEAVRTDGITTFANDLKEVTVGAPGTAGADLLLGSTASPSTRGWPAKRASRGRTCWSANRSLPTPPRRAVGRAVPPRGEADRAGAGRVAGLLAQAPRCSIQLFVTVQNRNRESPGFGDFYWFGVSIFDDRKEQRETSIIPGDIGLGKLIYSPAMNTYATPAPTLASGSRSTATSPELLKACRRPGTAASSRARRPYPTTGSAG